MPAQPNTDAHHDYNPANARAWARGWTYATAREAIDAHKRGRMIRSYQFAIDIDAHPAAYAARRQRRSAITALPWTMAGPDRAPGRIETAAAERLWEQARALLADIEDDIAVMGMAVVQHPLVLEETDAGPRWTIPEISVWPLSSVELGAAILGDPKADPYDPDRYYARTAQGEYVPLPRPGDTDLHWTVFGEGTAPHRRGAIVAVDLSFVAAQRGRRAWAKLIDVIGRTSIVGEMPPSTQMTAVDSQGNETETPVARDMLAMVTGIGETQVAGLMPHDADVKTVQVTATTADLLPQSFEESAREFAWALLGHDATISRGKSVYADPRSQDVPQDLTRTDERIIKAGFNALFTGLARLNCAKCAPITIDGHVPDADQDDRREAVQKRRAAAVAAGKAVAEQLAAERSAGAIVDQDRANVVYALAGLSAPRFLPPPAPATPQGAPAAPVPAPGIPAPAGAA